jgi:hypothetical protein
MNYTYKIKNNLVTEFKNKAYNEWNFEILKKKYSAKYFIIYRV